MGIKAQTISVGDGPSIFIIGAGIAAISVGIDLDKRGLTNWMAFERSDGIGGTWWANRYPGCRCDVPAIVYSHSKHPNPNWTQSHPERDEIQRYWANLAKTQNQLPRIKLRHNIVKCEWDSTRKLYYITAENLETKQEEVYEAQIVIGAAGGLSTPKYIDMPGEETFKGRVIHAAEWPENFDTSELRGKNVIVVGNGCSGVQIVSTLGMDPEINVVSLARARQWFVPSNPGQPRHSVPYGDTRRSLYNKIPMLLTLERRAMWLIMDSLFYWYKQKEGRWTRSKIEAYLIRWMKRELPDYMSDSIVPEHPFGSKRLIYEDGYFEALRQPNVKFIEGKIKAVHGSMAVLDDDREIPADYVILATGYDAEHISFHIHGSHDSTVNYKSKADLRMYRGMVLPGIPNMFTMLGNNTALNHMGITSVLELQSNYISQVIQAMRDYNIREIDVKQEAATKWDAWIEKELQKMTWAQVKNTYWQAGRNGRIFTHYPGSVRYMMWDLNTPVWKDFIGAESVARAQRFKRALFTFAALFLLYWGLFRTARGEQLSVAALALFSTVFARSKHALSSRLPTLAARVGISG